MWILTITHLGTHRTVQVGTCDDYDTGVLFVADLVERLDDDNWRAELPSYVILPSG